MSRDPTVLSLFAAHHAALVSYATGIVGDRAQAEDLVQEAWLRFDEATRGRLLEDATGYLYRIVRNLALDGRRRAGRESRLIAADAYAEASAIHPDAGPSPEAAAISRRDCERVLAALAELPERTRIAVEMHRFGGARLREIAAHLGISVSLAHRLVADGVQHCKHRLGWP